MKVGIVESDKDNRFDSSGFIRFNPNAGLKLNDGNILSPATGLEHEAAHAFNMKTSSSLIHYPIFNNLKLVLSFVICVFLQVSVISIDSLSAIFKVCTLDIFQWIMVWILAFMPIPIVELQKYLNTKKHRLL